VRRKAGVRDLSQRCRVRESPPLKRPRTPPAWIWIATWSRWWSADLRDRRLNIVSYIQPVPNKALDIAEESSLLGRAERNGLSIGAGSPCASYSVHIGLRGIRKIEINNVRNSGDIDATSRNICRN